jgi:type IV secretion system protein VirB10
MASRVPTDPRPGLTPDLRPIVAVPRRGIPGWAIGAIFAIAALLLFAVLDAHRRSVSAPAIRAQSGDAVGAAAVIPPLSVPAPAPTPTPGPTPTPPAAPAPPAPAPAPPQIVYVPQPAPVPPPAPLAPPPSAGDPALVIDNTVGDTGAAAAPSGGAASAAGADSGATTETAVRATVMRHRDTTVPQGTIIPAVLETALDSTRPGLARALVTRDVVGFDGSKVLIPRSSRLIGEYHADLQPGQNRALIRWTRLVRPDGATIALDSPTADPLGAIGVKGKVNSHFFTRFGSAILQSALDFGVGLGSRIGGGDSAVIVGLPGAFQSSAAPLVNNAQIAPTLKVKQGTAISVFVARDLDFTSVESRK